MLFRSSGFMPASFIRHQTLFTLEFLDFQHQANLEMKVILVLTSMTRLTFVQASVYQVWQFIKRQTAASIPSKIPNLYHELRRISRVWRWLKYLKWSGKSSTTVKDPPGILAPFCPSCPQASINIPNDWQWNQT